MCLEAIESRCLWTANATDTTCGMEPHLRPLAMCPNGRTSRGIRFLLFFSLGIFVLSRSTAGLLGNVSWERTASRQAGRLALLLRRQPRRRNSFGAAIPLKMGGRVARAGSSSRAHAHANSLAFPGCAQLWVRTHRPMIQLRCDQADPNRPGPGCRGDCASLYLGTVHWPVPTRAVLGTVPHRCWGISAPGCLASLEI